MGTKSFSQLPIFTPGAGVISAVGNGVRKSAGLGAQVQVRRKAELDAGTEAAHGLYFLGLGEIGKLVKRLVGRFRARANDGCHAAAHRHKELGAPNSPLGRVCSSTS